MPEKKSITIYSTTQNYLDLIRFSKPGGTLLIFLPHIYGLTVAAYARKLQLEEYIDWFFKLFVWSFVARSLGCTINDMCDYRYDREVERTKDRPLASGKISLFGAGLFLVFQSLVYFALLWTPDRNLLIAFPLMFMYPLMKRVTPFPQAWLGIAMNWGVVLAWTSIYGPINQGVIAPLMAGLWAWTMFYDTIYACQDRKDDLRIGVGSSAIALQSAIKPYLSLFAFAFTALFTVALRANNHSLPLVAIIAGGTTIELAWQIIIIDPMDPSTCKRKLANRPLDKDTEA
ncbi:unnamed protein product [Cyclocybe aegerita]|uniref:4-HB polyprenyltransferase n=1 Tax=Cyclocybe aegerita TaxID=1973307 RepID=A0A8S0XQT9_CYCAE|nr:unnamed protein product [Cyclocybe aegerita]